jgi:hypothetical protein
MGRRANGVKRNISNINNVLRHAEVRTDTPRVLVTHTDQSVEPFP